MGNNMDNKWRNGKHDHLMRFHCVPGMGPFGRYDTPMPIVSFVIGFTRSIC